MEYLKAFLCGGVLCAVGQILIDKTKLTPARILTGYVVAGVILSASGFHAFQSPTTLTACAFGAQTRNTKPSAPSRTAR